MQHDNTSYDVILSIIRRRRSVKIICRQIKKKLLYVDDVEIIIQEFLEKPGNNCFQASYTFRYSDALSRK